MSVDLSEEYLAALKREVNPPGTDLFPGVTDDVWLGHLADAFWEARLDGFLEGYTAEINTPTNVEIVTENGGADMPRSLGALVILYAGIRILRNRILNMNTQFRAKAGPVEFEQQNSATMLAEMLKQLKATKDRIILTIDENHSTVMVLDNYSQRVFSYDGGYYANPELTA